MADDDKSVGTYARLSLVDADGNELEKHYVRTRVCGVSLCGVASCWGLGLGLGLHGLCRLLWLTPTTVSNHTQARTFNPSNPASKRPDDEAWVAAKWGEKFGVKVRPRLTTPREPLPRSPPSTHAHVST